MVIWGFVVELDSWCVCVCVWVCKVRAEGVCGTRVEVVKEWVSLCGSVGRLLWAYDMIVARLWCFRRLRVCVCVCGHMEIWRWAHKVHKISQCTCGLCMKMLCGSFSSFHLRPQLRHTLCKIRFCECVWVYRKRFKCTILTILLKTTCITAKIVCFLVIIVNFMQLKHEEHQKQ